MTIAGEECIFVIGFCGQCVTASLAQSLKLFADEDWFHLSGYITAQNNTYWSIVNLRQTFEICLHDQKIGV
jgi:hypothetical protein